MTRQENTGPWRGAPWLCASRWGCQLTQQSNGCRLTTTSKTQLLNPFKAPEPLPILNPSNFVPKNGLRALPRERAGLGSHENCICFQGWAQPRVVRVSGALSCVERWVLSPRESVCCGGWIVFWSVCTYSDIFSVEDRSIFFLFFCSPQIHVCVLFIEKSEVSFMFFFPEEKNSPLGQVLTMKRNPIWRKDVKSNFWIWFGLGKQHNQILRFRPS